MPFILKKESRFLTVGDRDNDMYMLGLLNARERTAKDWSALLKGADERFQLTTIHQRPQSALAVVEVTWSG